MTPKILITNSVPVNGGDEALLRATIEGLRRRLPRVDIRVLCMHLELSRQYIPDVLFDADLEFAAATPWIYKYAFRHEGKQWHHSTFERLAPLARRQVLSYYREADLVLSSAGGFLNDFYGIETRLHGFEVALNLGKPLVLFAQSIGPFWRDASKRRILEILNRAAAVAVRDNLSAHTLRAAGVNASVIHETADAAFLFRWLNPDLYRAKHGPPLAIGLALRDWTYGKNPPAIEQTIKKAVALCHLLLSDPRRTLVFLSTCQGIPDYTDDSLVAQRVVLQLPRALQKRCQIDRRRYPPRELIDAYRQCDAFIGMRLHGCILSMLGGTAAMGLGYEDKTEYIYRQLGLEAYQVRYESATEEWLVCAERFLAEIDKVRSQLPSALDACSRRAQENLDLVVEQLRAL
jgi:colanic acid/amylovoran biosynthesis protein